MMGKSLKKDETVAGKIPQGGGADAAFSVRGIIYLGNREQAVRNRQQEVVSALHPNPDSEYLL
jgi:hypothetical protein